MLLSYTSEMNFQAVVERNGKTATGIEVPPEVIAELGDAKRPKVQVVINGYAFSTTVGVMGGRYLIPLSAERRTGVQVEAGQSVTVELSLDVEPTTLDVPDDLAQAFRAEPKAEAFFASLTHSQRKEWVRWVTEAKKAETRASRVEKSVALLLAGKKTH